MDKMAAVFLMVLNALIGHTTAANPWASMVPEGDNVVFLPNQDYPTRVIVLDLKTLPEAMAYCPTVFGSEVQVATFDSQELLDDINAHLASALVGVIGDSQRLFIVTGGRADRRDNMDIFLRFGDLVYPGGTNCVVMSNWPNGGVDNGGRGFSLYAKTDWKCNNEHRAFICQLPEPRITNCKDELDYGSVDDGVYSIDPDGQGSFNVYCDLDTIQTDGTTQAGWTVFQRRVDNSTDFYRNWMEYKQGFGDLAGNYWMGLDNLYRIISSGTFQLHVYLETFENESAYATYNQFSIGDESDKYRLNLAGYSGTAGNGLAYHNGSQFSTFDNDNDGVELAGCSVFHQGAWWFDRCYTSHLNGKYHLGEYSGDETGILWFLFKGTHYSLKTTVMKIRPL